MVKKSEGTNLLPLNGINVSSGGDHEGKNEDNGNLLNIWQGAALLTADCLGTGLLALPHDVQVLGPGFGIFFLVANLPINLFAGTILSQAARYVEKKKRNTELGVDEIEYNSILRIQNTSKVSEVENDEEDTATYDFIGMTSAIFLDDKMTSFVMILFYTNIFLVLGNYILVMSKAVSAMWLDEICIPTAGVIASVLMLLVSQLRTMSTLGRSASLVSLGALFIVVMQCLYFAEKINFDESENQQEKKTAEVEEVSVFRKLSAMGSIGFAVGSQKLLLNIRHESVDRESAPRSLAISLSCFGAFYVAIVLCAGENPPGFLFDAIPSIGLHRHFAGFFLLIHVVISYAINSQAICSSMDRLFLKRWEPLKSLPDERRWMLVSGMIAIAAFLVANAIPFFKDLVAFIGALTSVPLTLLLPAIFHRKIANIPIWWSQKDIISSFLVVFSVLFTASALMGSIYSIYTDWKNHVGGFFSCH